MGVIRLRLPVGDGIDQCSASPVEIHSMTLGTNRGKRVVDLNLTRCVSEGLLLKTLLSLTDVSGFENPLDQRSSRVLRRIAETHSKVKIQKSHKLT
jgi:hypothetical protein